MSFIHVKGPAKTEGFKKTASVAIAAGSVLSFDGTSGYSRQAVAASTRIAGVSLRKITSSSDDYADNSVIPVIVPMDDDVFLADVTGTAAQANVGDQFDLTANTDGTAHNVDLAATTYKVVTVVGFISASQVLVKFNGNYVFANKAN